MYLSADIVAHNTAIPHQTEKGQRHPVNDVQAVESVARTQLAVYRFHYGKEVRAFKADGHDAVGLPLQSDEIATDQIF